MNRELRPELLAPAGSYEAILAAAAGGADAVYVGGAHFGARAFAKNLTEEELLSAMDYLHLHGKRMYLTVNTLLKDRELPELYDYIRPLYEHGLDAVIVQDLGVMDYLRRQFPGLHLHISTQMTITNLTGVRLAEEMGASRVVLARELSLAEIDRIAQNTDLEIEVFVHGALCYCYSGQCLMSSVLGGRSGNRGRCAQPCRLPYDVSGKGIADRRNCYALSPRDICTIEYLPELLRAGVHSLKIEGRMKRPEYTYGVVKIYRKYLDRCLSDPKAEYHVEKEDKELLENLYTRSGFSSGYLKMHNGKRMMTLSKPDYITAQESFYKQLKTEYESKKIQEKIKGSFTLSKESPVMMEVQYGSHRISAAGAVGEAALSKGLDAEKVKSQICKTGNSPFLFESLDLSMDPDVFLPVSEIKSVRRDALEALEKEILSSANRAPVDNIYRELTAARAGRAKEPYTFTAVVRTFEQAEAVLRSSFVTDIYMEEDLLWDADRFPVFAGKAKEAGVHVYGCMPYIFREKAKLRWEELIGKPQIHLVEGLLVRSVDELGFLTQTGWDRDIRCDYGLYAMNTLSAGVLSAKTSGFTYSPEMKYQEMRDVRLSGGELYAYGYLPLMISAQCVGANVSSCTKDGGKVTLSDRYHKTFIVQKDCRDCQNIIYNSVPLTLIGMEDKVRDINPARIRLSFTREDAKTTGKVLLDYRMAFAEGQAVMPGPGEFTRGHFNRGVE